MGRLFKVKRIIALCCCTILLSMSIFSSYNTVVYAAHDYDIIDAADDVLNICLVIGGIIFSAPSGGLSYLATIKGIIGLRDSAENLIDYVTDNGDGTYTIDESLIQAALQAAEELEARGFTDSDITNQKNGRYELHYAVTNNSFWCTNHDHASSCLFEGVISMNGRAACYVFPRSDGTWNFSIYYADGSTYLVDYEVMKYPCGYQHNRGNNGIYGHTYGANVPIFSDGTACDNYLANGTGYKNAENYRPAPIFRRHSSYTPTYSGGAVTVNRTVIENITNKITEVDADDSLTDDQKIEILQQYIFSGGINPTPSPSPTDPDYDNNKDIPAGEDLADTNSWLKKIYLKICQIYAKMNAAVEDAEDAAIARIQESLDEIIEQLKKIRRWSAVDTVIDGVDAIADWLDLIRGVISDSEEGVGSAVSTVAEGLADSADSLSTKFPFSIPWDILFFISVFAAEPQVPYFEIPMDIEMEWLDICIHYDFVIDFSQFQWFSNLSRLILSMTYAVGLIRLTMNIALLKKEE